MVLTDRAGDNEEKHDSDDENDYADTRYLIHDDAWWSQHI